jgi:hypothetical protein
MYELLHTSPLVQKMMGLIVSKRLGSTYRSGRSRHWVKSKNPAAPAVKREAEEDLGVDSNTTKTILKPSGNDWGSLTMTDAQFELLLAAIREQHNELRAIQGAALGKLRGISYALYIILGIILCILAGLAGLAWLAWQDVPFLPTG